MTKIKSVLPCEWNIFTKEVDNIVTEMEHRGYIFSYMTKVSSKSSEGIEVWSGDIVFNKPHYIASGVYQNKDGSYTYINQSMYRKGQQVRVSTDKGKVQKQISGASWSDGVGWQYYFTDDEDTEYEEKYLNE